MPANFTRYASLADKTVLITGGGSGIGASIVEAFVANRSKVAFLDILEGESLALVERLSAGGNAPLFIKCDLTDIEALRRAITEASEKLGPIGVLVNNAANDQRQPIDEVTPESWDWTQALNLKHQFFAAQAVRPGMRKLGGGSIVNFSSLAWMKGVPKLTAYATAKAAVVGLTQNLARELGDENIRVNAVAPGAVMTERQRRLWVSEADMESFRAAQCLHVSLTGDAIAPAVLFLASDDARMVTKQCLVVDGGMH